jgi:protein SCO1
MMLALRLARRCAAVALLSFACAVPAPAATEALRGVVVSMLPAQGEAVVRHDAFGGMPAMTMAFHVDPSVLSQLHVGDRVTGRADISAETLADVRVVGHDAAGANASIVHNVQALSVGDELPPTTFFDQNGRGFSFSDFRGQTVLLAFIYTRCQDPRMCPLISAQFHQLQQKLAGLPIHLVEITLDPAYDTPEVLQRYGRQFDADPGRWTLGTGPVAVVQDFAARFGIAVFADPTKGLIHSERTAVINRDGAIVDLIDAASWNPDNVAAELRSTASLPSNPIARLDYELSKAAAALCGNNVPGTAGLLSLVLALGIFIGASWLLFRIGRKIFAEEP